MSHERVYQLLSIFGLFLYRTLSIAVKLQLRLLRRFIPFDNSQRMLNRNKAQLTDKEKYEYSLTQVLDALTPAHDFPNFPETLVQWFQNTGCENIVVRKRRLVVVVGTSQRRDTVVRATWS